ncbi:hypothetical protein HPA02_33830 [Bisbaumannia pacifica]|uniref:LemA family protein n=1 Tax=Bisbaumannia pacifica TaxID=77098 RepID=A0A510XGU2_9GAMM|nr:LemA family protein [Halomonas pacifica]GEK49100.1 hypothetical protein HPA02_33830 [Halomonas pacifica]
MMAGRARGHVDGSAIRLLIIVLLGVAAIAVPWLTHNQLVERREAVAAAWADVESNLQRRAELVPNLVRSLQAHMDYEGETLTQLVRERAQGLREALNEARGDPARLARLEAALTHDLGRLMSRAGEHPELRSGDQFLRFQAQLEGSDNRINVARMRYNAAVRDYNASLEGFFGRWVADAMGLLPGDYFEAPAGAHEPLVVEF